MVDVTNTRIQLYGAIATSILIVLGFIIGLFLAYMHNDQHNIDSFAILISNTVMIVVGYWLGSSMGSQKKDTLLLNAEPPVVVQKDRALPLSKNDI